jgi:hypothetical protein
MAYHNARNLAHRTVPLVRRELDKQLTVMVLVQVLITFCTQLPQSIIGAFDIISPTHSDPVIVAEISLAGTISSDWHILSYTVRVLSNVFYLVKY